MAKLTLTDLASLQNEQTVIATINNNHTLIETALENTLSRDGTIPNEMEANLDMNDNRILNLPQPVDDTEPMRKGDVEALDEFTSLLAEDINFDNSSNGFTADNVQDAIEETDTALDNHLADTVDAHDASAISVLDAGANYTATEVESALAEVMDALQAHEADTVDAHDASAISSVAAGSLSSTDVQAALNELDTEKQPIDSDLTAIAALSPSNDDIIQRKAGAWTNRTMTQLIADLAALGTTFQPLDSDLTAIAALTTNAAGRSILTLADPGADRIAFWDDSAGTYEHLSLSGLTITTTSLAVDAASDTAAGKVELATASETTTGTDATRAVTPDGLAGSDFGKTVIGIMVYSDATTVAVADGAGDIFFRIPATLNGCNLVAVAATVNAAGTTNTSTIQIANVTQAADMLSTKISIDSGETDSSTAATPAVIDSANDDVATGDKLRIDVDSVSTTPPTGLYVELTFQLP